MKKRVRIILLCSILFAGISCQLSSLVLESGLQEIYPALEVPAATLEFERTLTASAGTIPALQATLTPVLLDITRTTVPCAYVWDTQPLQEETAQLQVAFRENGLGRAEVWATAYGERCVNVDTKETSGGFLVLQTDVHVRMTVLDLEDEESLGKLLEQIVEVVSRMPEESFPGTQKGNVGVEFSQEDSILNLWFRLEEAEAALEANLQNEALLQALKRPVDANDLQ